MSTSNSSKFSERVIPLRELTMGDVLTVERGEAIRVWGRQEDVTDALQELMVHVEKWEMDAAASKRRDSAPPASEASKVILLADCRPSSRQAAPNRGMPHVPTADGKFSKQGAENEVAGGKVEPANTAAISIVTSSSKHVTQTEQDPKAISNKAPGSTENFEKVVKIDRMVLASSRDQLLDQLQDIGKKTSADCTLDDSLAIVGVNGRSTVERSAEKATARLEAWQRLRIMDIERQMKRTPSPKEAPATTPTTATATTTTMGAGEAQGPRSMTPPSARSTDGNPPSGLSKTCSHIFPANPFGCQDMEEIQGVLTTHFMEFSRIHKRHPRGADVKVEYRSGSLLISGPAEVADEIHQSYHYYFTEVARPALETCRYQQMIALDELLALNFAKEMNAPSDVTRAHKAPGDVSHKEHGPKQQSSAGPSVALRPIVEILPTSSHVPQVSVAEPVLVKREKTNGRSQPRVFYGSTKDVTSAASAARASEPQATTTAADVHLERPSWEAPKNPVNVAPKMKANGKWAISSTKDAPPPSITLPQTAVSTEKDNSLDSEEAIISTKPALPEVARNQPQAVVSPKPKANGLAPSAEPIASTAAPTLDSATTTPQTTEAYKFPSPTRTDTPSIDASITTPGYVSSLSKLQALRNDDLARFLRLPDEMQNLHPSSFLHLHAVVKRIGAVVGVNAGVYDKQRLFFFAYTHEALEEAIKKVDEHLADVWTRPELDVPLPATVPPLIVVHTQSGPQAYEANTECVWTALFFTSLPSHDAASMVLSVLRSTCDLKGDVSAYCETYALNRKERKERF
ncbi:hypothetical protein SpCBS45565_g05823 [Spizellomyces sp. 'palustris']|nr:hypothetical protein SpCBS45565_g05823 [Spizellomyces sp. 'palustris']